jgi:hypothetical protein
MSSTGGGGGLEQAAEIRCKLKGQVRSDSIELVTKERGRNK